MEKEKRLTRRLAMLEGFVAEARQRLDRTKGLSDIWFDNYRIWKNLDNQRIRAKIELCLIKNGQ